jgi:hypothetical protein
MLKYLAAPWLKLHGPQFEKQCSKRSAFDKQMEKQNSKTGINVQNLRPCFFSDSSSGYYVNWIVVRSTSFLNTILTSAS